MRTLVEIWGREHQLQSWEEWIQYEVFGVCTAAGTNSVPKLHDIFILSSSVLGGRNSVLEDGELPPGTGCEPRGRAVSGRQGLCGHPALRCLQNGSRTVS